MPADSKASRCRERVHPENLGLVVKVLNVQFGLQALGFGPQALNHAPQALNHA